MKKVKSTLHCENINNLDQYYTVQTIDDKKPILLFLHGGPGGANIGMASVLEAKSTLTEHFTIIQYDQRGAGKSYLPSMKKSDLSLDLLLDDLKQFVNRILTKFNQEKIFLVGHSFGTIMGIRLCSAIPEKIHSYIGMAQLTNMLESERLCTQESLQLCDEKNNPKAKAMIKESIKYFDDGNYPEYIKLQRLAMTKIGGFSFNRKPMMPSLLYIISALSPHYSIRDAINMKAGLVFSTDALWNEVMSVDLSEEVKKLDVPVYFILGEADIVASPAVAAKFINSLQAPKKEIVKFKKSGHSPQMEEKQKYEETVVNLFINQ